MQLWCSSKYNLAALYRRENTLLQRSGHSHTHTHTHTHQQATRVHIHNERTWEWSYWSIRAQFRPFSDSWQEDSGASVCKCVCTRDYPLKNIRTPTGNCRSSLSTTAQVRRSADSLLFPLVICMSASLCRSPSHSSVCGCETECSCVPGLLANTLAVLMSGIDRLWLESEKCY